MQLPLFEKITDHFIGWLLKDRPPRRFPLSDFTRIQHELRPGDVILIEGRNKISDAIKQVTQSPWSHAALYIGRLHDIENPVLRQRIMAFYSGKPDEQVLIESLLGKGTIVSSLKNYKDDHIRICRPRGLSRRDAQHVIGYAIGKLGLDYDVRHIFDLFRLLLPWGILPRRWRSSVFRSRLDRSTTRIVCSSLIAEAFLAIQFPILPTIQKDPNTGIQFVPRNPRLFVPRDFDYSPYFDIIKYPMFDLSTEGAYQYLPFNKNLTQQEDEL